LNSLNQKNTFPLLILLFSILALAAAYFYVVSPMLSKKSAKAAESVQKHQELTALQQKLVTLKPTGPKELVQLSQVRRKIPETDQVESLVRDLRMLETTSHMQLSSYTLDIPKVAAIIVPAAATPSQSDATPAPTTAPAASSGNATAVSPNVNALVQTIKFNQTVKGDYGQMIRFLEEIQTSERLMTIDKITFNMTTSPPVKMNVEKKQIVCTLSMNAYFSPGLQQFFKNKAPIYFSQTQGRVYPLY
jgi:Tfp pilus assembly protein PilO